MKKCRKKEFIILEAKRFFSNFTIVMVILFLLLKIFASLYQYRETEQDRYYLELVSKYEGIAEETKRQEILEKYEYYRQILAQFPEIQMDYATGKLTKREFEVAKEEHTYAETYFSAWERLNENTMRFDSSQNGDEMYYFYDITWEKLLDVGKLDILYLFLIQVVILPYFSLDRDSGLYPAARCMVNYKKVEKYRIFYGIVFAMVCVLLFTFIEVVSAWFANELPFLEYTANSLSVYGGARFSFSVMEMLLVKNLCRMIEEVVTIILLGVLTKVLNNKIIVMILIIGYMVVTNQWVLRFIMS